MDAGNVMDSKVLGALEGSGGAAPQGTSEALRNNFMTLLVTQLKNQDPLNPMENAELTSQLAQINTVGGIDALNDTLKGITSQIETGQSLQAAALIGKGVLVPGDRLLVGEEGEATPFGVELEGPAAELRVDIHGADGQLVHSLQAGALDAGVETFDWDGRLASGEAATAGAYRVVVTALAADGAEVPAHTLNYAIVSGISSGPREGVRLDLGGIAEPVSLRDVRQIL